MTISIDLGPELSKKLEERAAKIGQTPNDYTRRLVERSLAEPTFDEILAPVREQVAASGITEEELDELISEAIAEVRQERKRTAF